jgi:AcrR family transcriptional regulator
MTSSKRQQILDAALVLFVQQGLEGAATAKIAKAAGVATGTLFHHFANKQELITTLYLEIRQELADSLPELQPQQEILTLATTIWNSALTWAMAHPDKVRFLLAYYQSPLLSTEARKTVKFETLGVVLELLQLGQQQGFIADYPDDLMLEMCHTLFMTSAAYFIEHPQLAADGRQQRAAMAIFWNALATPGHQISPPARDS